MKIGGINLTNEVYQCIGCGATIQTEDPEGLGYLPASALAKGLVQESFYCQRCYRLRHYNELIDLALDEDLFLQRLSSIASDDAFVILVVDVFDVEGSIISGIQRMIGEQPFAVAVNKFDLLPKVTRQSKVKEWVRQIMNSNHLYPESVIITNGMKRSGIEALVELIEQYIHFKNIYIVGITNVGKSTLINQLIQHYGGEREIITTSNHPGTTLDMIQIPLTDEHSLIDTPGIIKKSQYAHYLSRDELKEVLPSKPLKPKTYQLKSEQTLFLGGLARIDVKTQADKAAVTLYVNSSLYIHRTKTEKASDFYEKHLGELLNPPHQKEDFPELKAQSYRLSGKEDLNISGLGWITSNAPINLTVWVPRGIAVTKRPSII